MRRLIRPALFTLASSAAVVGFVLAGRISAEPLAWGDVGGWLDRVEPVDAFAELARWIGLLLAVYVAVVSFAALLAELAATVRMPRLHRWLSWLVRAVALPSLRHRLLEVTAVATITASSLQAAPAGAVHSAVPVTLVAEQAAQPADLPALRGEFHGFGAPTVTAPAQAPSASYTVRKGDTLWDITCEHYGRVDAAMVDAVAAANPSIVDPDLILVGWELTLPELVLDRPVPEPPRTIDGEASWSVVTVREGDTLWDIVDEHYGNATAELIWATVEANPEIDDPALIHPGQLITLPPLGTGESERGAEPAPLPAEVDLPPPTIESPPVVPEPELSPMPTTAPMTAPTTSVGQSNVPGSNASPTIALPIPATAIPSPSLASSPVGESSSEGSEDGIAEDVDEVAGPSLAQLIGWTGGAGLAAALLGLAARRHRRRPTSERHQRPSERAVELGVALHETENVSTAEWAALALRDLANQMRPRPGEPTPVPRLLRLDGDHVELVWDVPNPEACAPWSTVDGGWSWTVERPKELRTSDAPSPCPGLVTVGKRDGADVLLNLESCGAIAVAGDPDQVLSLVNSMALELAASAFSDAPTVLMVGMPQPVASPEHARMVEAHEVLGWMRDRNDSATALLAHRRLTSLFALRARARPQDSHEPVIVIADPSIVGEEHLAEMIDLTNGDLGTVLVVASTCPSLTWQLECVGGQVAIQPLGLTLDGVGVARELDCLIEEFVPPADPSQDELEDAEELESEEVQAVLADHVVIAQERLPAAALPGVVEDGEWDVELKVLGQVRCVGLDEPLTPTELHLAIFLAFHPNGENSDTVATMVWPNGAAPRTITNTMASLRRKLGTGSDGEMLFPLGRDSQYVYKLSPRVTTDWDRFLGLARRAEKVPTDEAVELLDQALELIDGPPFRAPSGYSWAYSDGTASLISETVGLVARRCVDLHLERSEFLDAGVAAYNGTRTLDDAADDPLVQRVADALRSTGHEESAQRLLQRASAEGGLSETV